MAEFKKLGTVDIVEKASDSATVLIEENGIIKRVPKDEVGAANWDDLKNRPFYETDEIVEELVVAEREMYADSEGVPINDALLPLKENVTYIVTFNGIPYECIGLHPEDDLDTVYIGNTLGIDYEKDNGIPFTLIYHFGNNTLYLYSWTSELYCTIKVVISKQKVYPIDEKYLPDTVKDKADIINPTFSGIFCMNVDSRDTFGEYSHTEGLFSNASGDYAHAEGFHTISSGRYSHAEGYFTQASEDCAHAEGYNSCAIGGSSHAEGWTTVANGSFSHTEGQGTKSTHKSQHVEGEYNLLDTSTNKAYERGTYVHIVGNGTGTNNRSNAHTLDWNGNAWYQGTVESTAMIVKSSTEGSTKRFKITVDDSGTISATEIVE